MYKRCGGDFKSIMTKKLSLFIGWAKKPKKPNRLRNKTETERKNRLIELISSILVFVLYCSQFRFKFRFIKYKNRGFG